MSAVALFSFACTSKTSSFKDVGLNATTSGITLSSSSILRTQAATNVISNNCASCHSASTIAPLGTSVQASFQGPSLGAGNSGQNPPYITFNNFSDVRIAEVTFYNQALSLADRTSVECYLSSKYALGITESCAAANSTFTPTSVTGLQLWLKASSISAADGAGVSTWNDSSPNGYNFGANVVGYASVVSQVPPSTLPTFRMNSVNGNPSVEITNQWFQNADNLSPNVFSLSSAPELTATIVYQSLNPTSTSVQNVFNFAASAGGFGTSFGFSIQPETTSGPMGSFVATLLGSQNSVTQNVAHLADMNWHMHTATFTSGSFQSFLDGNLINVAPFGSYTVDSQCVQAGLVVPGNPAASPLYRALVGYGTNGDMPQNSLGTSGSAISASDAQTLNNWITQMGNP